MPPFFELVIELVIERFGLGSEAAGPEPGGGPAVAVAGDVLIHDGVSLLEASARKRPEKGELRRGESEAIEPAAVGVGQVVIAFFPHRRGDQLDLPVIQPAGLVDRANAGAHRIGVGQIDAGRAGLQKSREGMIVFKL